MAATAEGSRLTREHQQAQLRLRAKAIGDWTKLWPLWDGSGERFRQLADASIPLVRNYHRVSGEVALDYYRRLRLAEVVKSRGAVDLKLPEISDGQIAGTLYITGRDMTYRALAAGHSPQAAMQNALVRTAGSMTRLILNGGRDALVRVSEEDGAALGYRRITTGTCDFCAELASAGVMQIPNFSSHDHCGCVAEPAFAHLTRAIAVVKGPDKDTKSILEKEGALAEPAGDAPERTRRKRPTAKQANPTREDSE